MIPLDGEARKMKPTTPCRWCAHEWQDHDVDTGECWAGKATCKCDGFQAASTAINLDNVKDPTGYKCPWCLAIIEGGVLSALDEFELHIDVHIEQGDELAGVDDVHDREMEAAYISEVRAYRRLFGRAYRARLDAPESGRITAVDVWAVLLSLPAVYLLLEYVHRF